MPALQSIAVTDRAATPVTVTMTPKGRPDGVAVVGYSADGSTTGLTKLTISTRESGGKRKKRLVFSVPVVATETINGVNVPTVIRTAYVDVTFTFDYRHTEGERNNVVGQFYSLFATNKVLTNDVLVKDEEVY